MKTEDSEAGAARMKPEEGEAGAARMKPEESEAGAARMKSGEDKAGAACMKAGEGEEGRSTEKGEAATLHRIAAIPARIAQQRPLVHMIPNSVTVALCTDGLSALGARPLMAVAPEEMDEIPAYADAVVVNMGQPTAEKLRAAKLALLTAQRCGVPIVWDPVGAGASQFRRREFQRLLALEWRGIVKGNESEIAALQSGEVSHQGIDSIGAFALQTQAEDERVWAVSGQRDVVFDAVRRFSLQHEAGKKLRLTGSGCLTGAVMGACCAVERDPVTAALAAFFLMAYAGEQAARQSGYGSQKQALLDALTEVDGASFAAYVEEAAGSRRFSMR